MPGGAPVFYKVGCMANDAKLVLWIVYEETIILKYLVSSVFATTYHRRSGFFIRELRARKLA